MVKVKKDPELINQPLNILKEKLKTAYHDWFKLGMDLKTNKLKNVHKPRSQRKEIARIKTVIREKELKELIT
jgi:ribosomal protein L29